MEKSLKIVFYTFFGAICLGVVYLTTVMYLSPRQDADERGFIVCTKGLVINLQTCEVGSIWCPLKLLVQDMKCNIKVVSVGALKWVKGAQSTPWANYLFEPKPYVYAEQNEDIPNTEEAQKEMSDLAEKNRFIARKQQELEEAKHRQLHLNQGVLLNNPESRLPIANKRIKTVSEDSVPQGDISDEGNIDFSASLNRNLEKETAPVQENIVHKLQKQTQEKLSKGNLKDEK